MLEGDNRKGEIGAQMLVKLHDDHIRSSYMSKRRNWGAASVICGWVPGTQMILSMAERRGRRGKRFR